MSLRISRVVLVLFLAVVCIALASMGWWYSSSSENTPDQVYSAYCPSRCNVILIIADTLSAEHMSLHGYGRKTTPYLDDLLARRGIVYENAWSTNSWTLPSFASMLHSQYPSRLTVDDLITDRGSLPDYAHSQGVETVAFLKNPKPTRLSIIESITNMFADAEVTHNLYHAHEKTFADAEMWLERYAARDETAQGTFFMTVHDTTVHDPYDPPAEFLTAFGGNPEAFLPGIGNDVYMSEEPYTWPKEKVEQIVLQYDQEVLYLDSLLKKFVGKIPEELSENTVVIFTSDHGESFGEHPEVFYHDRSVYETELHVPLFVLAPGSAGARISEPASLIDLAPTILTFLGLRKTPSMEGVPLPLPGASWRGTRPIAERGELSFPVRSSLEDISEDKKGLPLFSRMLETTTRLGEWKIIKSPTGRNRDPEVYNLKLDPGEQANLLPAKGLLKADWQGQIEHLQRLLP